MANDAKPDSSHEEHIRKLEEENKKLKKKISRLDKAMEITSKHSDVVAGELEEKVEASVKEMEERVRIISETMPVPVVIAGITNGKIIFANELACRIFGLHTDEIIKHKVSELYENLKDRDAFVKLLAERGRVSNYEVKLKKKTGEIFSCSLFCQMMDFKNEPCAITVIYDLTERKKAEEEIRQLREQLDQREVKYLIFSLDDVEYGIELSRIREIIGMMPITSVTNMPDYVKGVINLRGKVIPIIDFRIRLGLKPAGYTDRTCIIVIEAMEENNQTMTGFIVDVVKEVRGINKRAIELPPLEMFSGNTAFISGIAKSGDHIQIILNCNRL